MRRAHTVVGSGRHGEGTKQDYFAFTVQDAAGNKALLKFRHNAPTMADEWKQVLAQFILACGVEKVSDTEELHDKQVELNIYPRSYQTISGLEAMKTVLA